MNNGSRGRGRGSGEQPGRRELRRPMDEVVRGMAKLDPSFGDNLTATPAPSADGWSSGVNRGEEEAAVVVKSRLNVSAHEFVPKSTLNITAQEFVPRSLARNTTEAALSETIGTLTYSPGMFDVSAGHLADIINANPDRDSLEKIADIIVETSIREINFRYTGARLCHYLSALVTSPTEGQGFRDILLKRCTDEHAKLHDIIKTNVVRVRAFTSFLADLFLQLSYFVGDVQRRYTFLGEAVLKSLQKLSEFREKENLKCIAQTLKMAGSVLEYEEKNSESSDGKTPLIDKLMDSVIETSKDPNVEPHIATMMGKLPDLRQANWGLGANGQVPVPPPHPVPTYSAPPNTAVYNSSSSYNHNNVTKNGNNQVDAGTFYAPDGTELTPEEYEFMNAQIEDSELADFPSEEMPEDIEKAYEEFLNSQNNAKIVLF
ncbi:PAIP1 [Lepeophtheirus salmonis]|uniref:PAIP1 n=1 Tax=Lepeophtheirus salmonis TaxID=72036 RepID=A0A7R8D0Q0_LEPSM|nr:PAIP1 [Lepeophtheirus salmonis]CAF2986347.1 PAIP1 [Lepeophtheirus salmonis]